MEICNRLIKNTFDKSNYWLKRLKLINCIFTGGKSSILLDVKPWDDETDMKKLEEAVRSVEIPGLTWGACMIKTLKICQSFSYICGLPFD